MLFPLECVRVRLNLYKPAILERSSRNQNRTSRAMHTRHIHLRILILLALAGAPALWAASRPTPEEPASPLLLALILLLAAEPRCFFWALP